MNVRIAYSDKRVQRVDTVYEGVDDDSGDYLWRVVQIIDPVTFVAVLADVLPGHTRILLTFAEREPS